MMQVNFDLYAFFYTIPELILRIKSHMAKTKKQEAKKLLDVIKNRYTFFGVSGALVLFSLISFFAFNINLWIDMTWGTQSEYTYETDVNLDEIRLEAKNLAEEVNQNWKYINTTSVYKISGENKFVVETGFNRNVDEVELEAQKINFKEAIDDILTAKSDDISLSRYVNIGASFGDYIKNTAIITLAIAIVGITIYVAYAFSGAVSGISSLTFGIITIITLFHDVLISSGLYLLVSSFFPEFKVDTFFITALLTILGYSINDTIVVFDRVRANLKMYAGKGKDLKEIINIAVTETLRRSIYTSLTLAFVLLTIFLFGPESISGFTLVMIFGTLIGTFSSIFIASPLLYEINKNKTLKEYKKIKLSAEDKIIV